MNNTREMPDLIPKDFTLSTHMFFVKIFQGMRVKKDSHPDSRNWIVNQAENKDKTSAVP